MRASEPVARGEVRRNGIRVGFEIHGAGSHTILLLPTWSIVHSRSWKMQVPFLARHFRVVTFDGRGNGDADRPLDPAAYTAEEFAADAVAVLDATATPRALVISFSIGAPRALVLAAEHPDRVAGLAFVGPTVPLAPPHPARTVHPFDVPAATDEGWAKFNRHYWRRDYPGFAEFFFSQVFTERHSTKPIEDCVGWALETTPEVLEATVAVSGHPTCDETLRLCERLRAPVLVIHGDEDAVSPHARGRALAEATGGALVTLAGCGHAPHVRDPVQVNLLLRDFAHRVFDRPEARAAGAADAPRPRETRWTRASRRPRRALFISSPIGLGHVRRDLAIARELRALVPDLRIDWLAQDPVTRVLDAAGERIHPASAALANESRHIHAESREHELHVFQAIRRMDEILLANFMIFHDVVREQPYDLWVGDEAWELDYYLHENPELKTAPYAWLTDFVGWLPMPEGGEAESAITADYNAEMIRHIARHPRVRDRAIFIGAPGDIVPDAFGPGLPMIREWTEAHYRFSGYIPGFDQPAITDRAALRAALGYDPAEQVCIAAVGGSGVGAHLLRAVIAALPAIRERCPAMRMIAVAGPRIDAATLPRAEGLAVRPYVPELYRHLAACDLALVQGGLATTMELTAAGRPFLYFPLRRHFEQQRHVPWRLDRYGAGRRMDIDGATSESIADAVADAAARPVQYRPVENGARRAAEILAELL